MRITDAATHKLGMCPDSTSAAVETFAHFKATSVVHQDGRQGRWEASNTCSERTLDNIVSMFVLEPFDIGFPSPLPAVVLLQREIDHLMADSLARQDGSQGKGEACYKRPVPPLPGLWPREGSPLYHTAVVVWLLPSYPLGCLLQL